MSDQQKLLRSAALVVGNYCAAQGGALVTLWMGLSIDGLDLSKAVGGWLATTQLGVVSLTTLCAARFLGDMSRRSVFVVGLLLSMAGNAASAAAFLDADPVMLFVSRAIAGLGEGLLFATVYEAAGRTHRPIRIFAYINGIGALLIASAFTLLPHSVGHYGPASIYVVMAVVAGVALPLGCAMPGRNEGRPFPAGTMHEVGGFRGESWRALTMLAVLTCVMSGTFAFTQQIGTHRLGLGLDRLGMIIGFAALLMVSGPWLAQRLDNRFGQSAPVAFCLLLYALVAASFAFGQSEWLFTAATIGHALAVGFAATFLSAFLVMLDASGRSIAAMPAFINVGGAAGPAVVATVIPAFPEFQAIAWVAVVLLVVVAIGLLPLTMRMDRGLIESTAATGALRSP